MIWQTARAKPQNNGKSWVGRYWVCGLSALLIIASPLMADEYAYCCGITTGKVKSDFTFVYTEFAADGTPSAEATTAVTVTESPSASGCYVFDGLTSSVGGLHYAFIAQLSGAAVCDYFYPWGSAPDDIAWTSPYQININQRVWKQGDTRPSLAMTVSNMSQDPTGWTCKFTLWNAATRVAKVSLANCTIGTVSGSGSYSFGLQYDWAASDLNMSDCNNQASCNYYAEFKVYSGADIYTFPPGDSLQVTVNRRR